MRNPRVVLLSIMSLAASLALAGGAAAGGGCHPPLTGKVTQGGGSASAIGECRYEPTVLYVDPGTEVTWTNEDSVPHSITGVNGSWGTEKLLSRGETITYSFETRGVFPYYCVLHPGMAAAVVVGDPDPGAIVSSLSFAPGGAADWVPEIGTARKIPQAASPGTGSDSPWFLQAAGLSASGLLVGAGVIAVLRRWRRRIRSSG